MDLIEISKALVPAGLTRRHGGGLLLHGTGLGQARSIASSGMRSSSGGTLGRGSYLTDSMTGANIFGTGNSYGMAHRGRGKRIGRVFGFKPRSAPLRSGPFQGGSRELTFDPAGVGSPVHAQNVNRTSSIRSQQRDAGVAPLPKTGFSLPAPAPVSSLSRSELADRRAAVQLRRRRSASMADLV